MNNYSNLQYDFYDGECFITFDVIEVNFDSNEITIAVTNRGRISVLAYDLLTDRQSNVYFEYGIGFEKIYLNEFEEAA